jgi:hypothetical protein
MTAVAVATVAAVVLLRVFHILFLQSLLVVGSAAVMAGIVIWERHYPGDPDGGGQGGGSLSRVKRELEFIDERLRTSKEEREKSFLRLRKIYLEQELRRLEWTQKEFELERNYGAAKGGPLKPLGRSAGTGVPRRRGKAEAKHLLEALDQSAQILAADPPASARTELGLVANDLRAHYGLIKGDNAHSQNLRDYFATWAVLTSFCQGTRPEIQVQDYASKDVKSKLEVLIRLAGSREVIPLPPAE